MTKHFENRAAQGDVYFERIEKLPDGVKLAETENGKYIVTHSETGHHHVMESRNAQMFIDETNSFIAYLKVTKTSELQHLREYDTHETLAFKPGVYRVRRQREATPEGWQRAQD